MLHGRGLFVIFASVCALTLTAGTARAQILYGSITGIARDAQGAAIPDSDDSLLCQIRGIARRMIGFEDIVLFA